MTASSTIETNGTHTPQAISDGPPVQSRQAWRDAVAIVAQRALDHYGDPLAGRLDKARRIVLAGGVEPDGEIAHVSTDVGANTTHPVTYEGCRCTDAERKAPQGLCKHHLAGQIYRRACEVAMELLVKRTEPVSLAEPDETSLRIPQQFITHLHGKEFVQFGGLLAMAHQQGLQSLDARFVSVQGDLATAEATATFDNGRTFTECGDATPDNVHPNIRLHFARMALTRAKARALRDALNIGMCALEELAD